METSFTTSQGFLCLRDIIEIVELSQSKAKQSRAEQS